jgi:hypothetical protein
LNIPVQEFLRVEDRSWRDILSDILDDLAENVDIKKLRQSLNGIMASTNGKMKHDRDPAKMRSECLQRIHIRAEREYAFELLMAHPLFDKYVNARIQGFLNE